MNKIQIHCIAILCLAFSCTNKNNPPEKNGSLFITFQSSPSAIVDMPVILSSIEFINQEGGNITIQVDKALQLAWLNPQFISAITLPQGQYEEIIFTLNMTNNPITFYEAEAKTWREAQVIDHNNQRISQVSRPIQIKQTLERPLIILDRHDAFMRLTLDMHATLKPAILNESLLQFTPIFQVDMPAALMIEGYVAESSTPNHLIVAIGDRYLQINNAISQLNHINRHNNTPLPLNGARLKMIAEIHDGELQIQSNSVHAITQSYHTGWLIEHKSDLYLIGHRLDLNGESTFMNTPISRQQMRIYEAQKAIDPSQLQAGQSVTLYDNNANPYLYLKKVNVAGEVIDSTTNTLIVQPLTLDGKNYKQFGEIPAIFQQPKTMRHYKKGDYITLSTYFTQSITSPMIALEDEQIPNDSLDVVIDFSLISNPLLFYDTDKDRKNYLFFTDELTEARITASLVDTSIPSSINIDIFHFSIDSIYTSIVNYEKTNYPSLQAMMEDIAPSLNTQEQKILSIKATGHLTDDKFLAHELQMTLQNPIPIANKDTIPSYNQITLIDLNNVNNEDRQAIENKKTPIIAIIGGTIGGIVGAVGLSVIGVKIVKSITGYFNQKEIFSVNKNHALDENLPLKELDINRALDEILSLKWDLRKRIIDTIFNLDTINDDTPATLISEIKENYETAKSHITHDLHAKEDLIKKTDGIIKKEVDNLTTYINDQFVSQKELLKTIHVENRVGSSVTEKYNFFDGTLLNIYHANTTLASQSAELIAYKIPETLKIKELLLIDGTLIDPHLGTILPDPLSDSAQTANDNDKWQVVYIQNEKQNMPVPPENYDDLDRWHEKEQYNFNFKENITIEAYKNIYRVTLEDGTKLFMKPGDYWGFYSKNFIQQVNQFITTTPTGTRAPFYFSTTIDNDLQGIYKEIVNHKSAKSNNFRTINHYRPDQATRDEDGVFKNWPYMPDQQLALNAQNVIPDSNEHIKTHDDYYNEKIGKEERRNPKELRIHIQLENDEYAVNRATYESFIRYPEHSIIIQMNQDGDARIVNGIDNLLKFSEEKFQGKVIWQPHGHGNVDIFGEQSVEQLSDNMINLVKNAAQDANTAYQKKHHVPLNLTMDNFKPDHINMDGCLLGKLDKFNHTFMGRFADSFYDKVGLAPTYEAFNRTIADYQGTVIMHPSNIGPGNALTNTNDRLYATGKEAYEKGHIFYKPGGEMPSPAPSGADYETSTYFDPVRRIKVGIFRGPEMAQPSKKCAIDC